MDYKATWKMTRKDEYTVGDRVFAMPADYLCKKVWRDMDDLIMYGSDYVKDMEVPIGYTMPLDVKSCNELYEKMEGEMGTKHDLEIVDLIWEGVELVNNHKRLRPVNVIFNNPATIVFWADGTKTVVTDMDNVVDGKPKPCESYSKEMGLALCYMKKALGNEGNYNNAFRKWIKEG